MQVRPTHVGVAQVRSFEMGPAKTGATQVRTRKSCAPKAGAAKHRFVQVSTREISAVEVKSTKIGT
jgi:hypothetical protein